MKKENIHNCKYCKIENDLMKFDLLLKLYPKNLKLKKIIYKKVLEMFPK